jgi:hypothetical protein
MDFFASRISSILKISWDRECWPEIIKQKNTWSGKQKKTGKFVLTVFTVLLVFFIYAVNAQACWNIRRQFVWVCFVFLNLPSHASFNKLGPMNEQSQDHTFILWGTNALDFSKFSIGQQRPNLNTHHDEKTRSRNGVEEKMSPVILILSKQFFLTIICSITDLNFLNLLNY